MQRGMEAEGELPPARKRRWAFGVLPAALLVASAAVTMGRSFRPEDPWGSTVRIVAVLSFGVLLYVAVLWWYSRSRQRLHSFLETRFPNRFIVMARTSPDFADAIEGLTGKDLATEGPRSWIVGFVDRGDAAEIWHFDYSTPRLLVRFPWASVTAVSEGTQHGWGARDRVVTVTVGVDGRHFRVPLSPQRDSLVARPALEGEFTEILARIRKAHAGSA